jgi:CRISPR-associated protein Cas8a1/Csx13
VGKRKRVVTVTESPSEQSLTWRLSDLGMDLLERAGLAGLYMALRAAAEAKVDLSPLTWMDADLTPDSVTVRWTGPAKPAFESLMKWAWQVQDGMLYLPAIHGERELKQFHFRVPTHNGILSTFLQHVNVQPRLDFITRIVDLGEEKQITVSYAPPAERVNDEERGINPKTKRLYQKKVPTDRVYPVRQCEELFDGRQGRFKTKPVALSNWVYPGIAGRYKHEVSWEGPAPVALLLMFAPTVCLYQRLQGEGNNYVVVVPDIRDLQDFAETRRLMNLDSDFIDVASLGDAGLQFEAEYSTRNPRRSLGSGCRVMAMGYVGYYEGQSIRKAVLDVPPALLPVRRYKLLQGNFKNTYVPLRVAESDAADAKPTRSRKSKKPASEAPADGPKAKGFIKLPAARGRIADNLVNCRPWYENLLVPQIWDLDEMERQRKKKPGTSIERLWFEAVCYQRSKLMKLIQEDAMWDTEAEKVFVEAFWEAMDSLYAQEAAATERGGSRSITDRFEDLNDDIRRKLTQAKTRTLLRAALADLFAKAGRQKTIRTYPAAVWRLIDHPDHWRKGRDLALLALASHRKKEERESSTPKNGE